MSNLPSPGSPSLLELLDVIGIRGEFEGIFAGTVSISEWQEARDRALRFLPQIDRDPVMMLDLADDQVAEVESIIDDQAEPFEEFAEAVDDAGESFSVPQDRLPTVAEIEEMERLRHEIGDSIERLVRDAESEADDAESKAAEAEQMVEDALDELAAAEADLLDAEAAALEAEEAYLEALNQWDENRPEPE